MRPSIRRLLTALLLAGVPVMTSAQTIPASDLAKATLEDLLNVVITTATRTPEGLLGAPARVQVVTAAQVKRRGYRSVAELLKDLPDFKLDLGGDPDYPAEITLQGTRGAGSIVLLLDGIRISSPTNEPLPILANYPVHNARQIEIVYGPASALYGADAFSGVINIISKDVADSPGLSVSSSVGQFGLRSHSASYGVRLGPHATLQVAGQIVDDRQADLSKFYPADYAAVNGAPTGTFNTMFGPMTASGAVSPTFENPLSAHSLQAVLRVGGLQLMVFENQSRTSTTPPYTPANGVYDAAAFNHNRLLVTAATYTRAIGPLRSTSTLTFSRHELDPQSGYWNVFSNMARSYKHAYGSLAKVEEQVAWKPAPTVEMIAGATFERFFAIPQTADLNAPVTSREAPGTILGTNITDEFVKLRYNNAGVFGQMQYAVTPAVKLTLGARADYNTRYYSTFNPRVGLVAQPSAGTTLKVLYGSAFLAPSPYQTYGHFGSFNSADGGRTYSSPYWHVANPDLKPQHKKTVEINLLQTAGERFHFSASGFHAWFNNRLKFTDDDQAYSGDYLGWPVDYIDFPVNEGRARTFGGTFALGFLHAPDAERRLEANAAMTLTDGRVWQDGEDESNVSVPLGAMAPLQLRLSADLDWHRWSVAPRLAVVGTQRVMAFTSEDETTRRTLPGYAVLDVTMRRRGVFRNVDAFVMIENALDRRYRAINAKAYASPEELIGAPQHPRRISVGFDLRLK